VTGLILELVWSRYLQLIFGVSVYAVATVLACFMFGLAIGSWHIGKLVDRTGALRRLFILLQLGIGLFCLFSSLLYKGASLLAAHGSSDEHVFTCVALSLLFLAFPTYLVGGVFPVLTKLAVGSELRVGQRVGAI